jgi:hypothetical protein
MSGTIIDMHMHTVLGAYDSGLQPAHLAEDAERVGLTGVAVTEHDRMWDRHTLARFREDHPALYIQNGMEVSTEMGHVLAVGLPRYISGIHRIARLREVADEAGGFLIAAHPFRHWFDPVYFTRQGKPPVEMEAAKLAELPLFSYVDALEVLNGCNSVRENVIAFQVAQRLGKPGTAGSDCHSRHGIGFYCTVFEKMLEGPETMLAELHAGRFAPHEGLLEGNLKVFSPASSSELV